MRIWIEHALKNLERLVANGSNDPPNVREQLDPSGSFNILGTLQENYSTF